MKWWLVESRLNEIFRKKALRIKPRIILRYPRFYFSAPLNRFSISSIVMRIMVGRPWGQVCGFLVVPRRCTRCSISRSSSLWPAFTVRSCMQGRQQWPFPDVPESGEHLFHQLMQRILKHTAAVSSVKNTGTASMANDPRQDHLCQTRFLGNPAGSFHGALLFQVKVHGEGRSSLWEGAVLRCNTSRISS